MVEDRFVLPRLGGRSEYFRYLDGLSVKASEDRTEFNRSSSLVKSYLLELDRHGKSAFERLSQVVKLQSMRLDEVDETMCRLVNEEKQCVALAEFLDDRFLTIYTLLPANDSDYLIGRLSRDSAELDQAWFAADVFRTEWERIKRDSYPHRFVKFGFEYSAPYESDESYYDPETLDRLRPDADVEFDEHRTSRFYLTERIARIERVLPQFELYDPLRSITQLRVPSAVKGGQDVYFNGKMTNRSPSFDEHRLQARYLLSGYGALTRDIETKSWLRFEQDDTSVFGPRLRGVPVYHRFKTPLSEETFSNWIESLRKTNNVFRLYGWLNRLSKTKVHFVGVDKHMWQPLNLEITVNHVVALLPNGTCANIVNRLITNLQRLVDPAVDSYVGSESYAQLVGKAFSAT